MAQSLDSIQIPLRSSSQSNSVDLSSQPFEHANDGRRLVVPVELDIHRPMDAVAIGFR
jgi:hypothetical protein